jgi:hypothetical protein
VTDVKAARAALDELSAVLGWLAASLLPGTAKPYRAPQMSAEKRAELDQVARHENALARRQKARSENVMTPLGEVPAPCNLDVMDLLADLLTAADEMAETVAVTVHRPVNPPASSAFADPAPYLDLVREHLDLAATVDDTLDRWVAEKCRGLLLRANNQLGLVMDGQLLAGLCPWCGGRTSKHPVGGARTLRIRLVAVGDDSEVPAVVCESSLCEPPDEDFGTTWRGRPAWPLDTEGVWLSRRIEMAAQSEERRAS